MTPRFPVIPCPEEQFHKGTAAEAEGSDQLRGTKRTCTLRLHLSGALAFTGSIRALSVANTSQEPTWAPLASAFPVSGAMVPVLWEVGKSTHLKGTELAQAQPSGLLLQQLGVRPHP